MFLWGVVVPSLELVVVGVEGRDLGLETLADTDIPDGLLELAALVDGRYNQDR